MTPSSSTPDPRPPWLRDLLASVVVFLVALPLCMGIALASGVPPALGLVTGIVGGVVVGLLAGSPLQVSGPAAGLAVLVYQLVSTHGLAALGPVVLAAGALQLLAGSLRLGQWFRAVSPAVIQGMLAGIGILILLSQVHVMIDDAPRGSGLENLVSLPHAFMKAIGDAGPHGQAASLGLVTISVLIGWGLAARALPSWLKVLPPALVAVVAASLGAFALRLDVKLVDVPGGLLGSLLPVGGDGLALLLQPALLGQVLAFALIASAESLLCASAVDAMHRGPRTDYDRELRAQGVGNVLCGALGALPLTGVIVRSSANVQAGAVTRTSAVLHGVWLLLLVAALPSVLGLIPTAALAAVLVYTGFKLVNLAAVRALHAHGRGEVLVWTATVAGVVLVDLLTGVLIGLAVATARVLWSVTRLEVNVADEPGGRVHVHLRGAATFLAIPRLARAFEALPRDADVQVSLDQLTWVDAACQDFLQRWGRRHAEDGGRLTLCWDTLRARGRAAEPQAPPPPAPSPAPRDVVGAARP